MKSRGKPICVVCCNKKTGELTINEENLLQLEKKLKATKGPNGEAVKDFSVFGIAGQFRTGKSFMLSFFVRYLSTDPEILALSPTAFIDQVKNFRETAPEGDLFEWGTRDRGVTRGIWFFSKPFVVKSTSTNGVETYVAVLLMDTQGLFDTGTHKQCDLRIFGLSLSLSSHQILNVKGNIDTQLFDKLRLFSAYAKDVSLQIDKYDADGDDTKIESKENNVQSRPRFQTLQFLIRDFGNFPTDLDEEADKGGVKYVNECNEKAKSYINNVLDGMDAVEVGVKAKLLSTYSELSCFCLPHPGNKMTTGAWNGDATKIDKEFKVLTAGYIESLFGLASNTGGPTPKVDRFGTPTRASSFADTIRETVDMLNRTGNTYDVGDAVDLLARNRMLQAQQECLDGFETHLKELCGTDYTKKYVNQDDFKRFLLTAERRMLADFDLTVRRVRCMSLGPERVDAIAKMETETKESMTKKSEELERNNALREANFLDCIPDATAAFTTASAVLGIGLSLSVGIGIGSAFGSFKAATAAVTTASAVLGFGLSLSVGIGIGHALGPNQKTE